MSVSFTGLMIIDPLSYNFKSLLGLLLKEDFSTKPRYTFSRHISSKEFFKNIVGKSLFCDVFTVRKLNPKHFYPA